LSTLTPVLLNPAEYRNVRGNQGKDAIFQLRIEEFHLGGLISPLGLTIAPHVNSFSEFKVACSPAILASLRAVG